MKIVYWVSEDWYFVSHRLRIATKLKDEGHDVYVVTNLSDCAGLIKKNGLTPVNLELNRSSFNLFADIGIILSLLRIYRSIRPDVVHHVAMKPVLYGSIVARLLGVPRVINALAGLGYLFSSEDVGARITRPFVKFLFGVLLKWKNSVLVVQNRDDYGLFVEYFKIPKTNVQLIKGVGVSLSEYEFVREPEGRVRAVLLARLLRDKGVYDFVDAAVLLRDWKTEVDLVLVGDIDLSNPTSVRREELRRWLELGVVSWWGHRKDVSTVWRNSHISVLPSYREGLPKSLLESAACGRAMIATDVPGCREIVCDATGVLVPVRNAMALAKAIRDLVEDGKRRRNMGEQARRLVEREFSDNLIDDKMLELMVGS